MGMFRCPFCHLQAAMLTWLYQRIRNSVKVRGENNSKAIFIFTTVTIIVLPLSFISSVLSMNTIDVRQMQQGSMVVLGCRGAFHCFRATCLPVHYAVQV